MTRHRALITYFVVLPLVVGVVLTALLYVGVPPGVIFFPGNALKSLLRSLGWSVHNRVGVIATAVFWWLFAAGGMFFARHRSNK